MNHCQRENVNKFAKSGSKCDFWDGEEEIVNDCVVDGDDECENSNHVEHAQYFLESWIHYISL